MHYIYTDFLGSLRCITDANGNVEQHLSYDAWGYRRDPVSGEKLSSSAIGGMMFARGFTGHEHMDEFGFINMNGRVYDPALGIFLSPDNYVQAPDFTQNYNRYAYCLNNPLMYTDPTGYTWGIFKPFVRMAKWIGKESDQFGDWVKEVGDQFGDWQRKHHIGDLAVTVSSLFVPILDRITLANIGASLIEVANNGGDWSKADPTMRGTKINNSSRITQGLFAADTRKAGWGWQIVSRFTYQINQTIIGYGYTQFSNIAYDGKQVEFIKGATVLSVRGDITWTYAITFSNYITGEDIFNDPQTLRHEYGHYLQSQSSGPLYLLKYGIPSAIDNNGWYEDDATSRGNAYFSGIYKASDYINPSWWEFIPSVYPLIPILSLNK